MKKRTLTAGVTAAMVAASMSGSALAVDASYLGTTWFISFQAVDALYDPSQDFTALGTGPALGDPGYDPVCPTCPDFAPITGSFPVLRDSVANGDQEFGVFSKGTEVA